MQVCALLDEATASTLFGFPAKYFGPGDPLARSPLKDVVGPNRNGIPMRIAGCGFWESGVPGDSSRSLTVSITQADPSQPGLWSVDAARSQFKVVNDLAGPSGLQPIAGLGDEAFAVVDAGSGRLVARSADLILDVSASWGAATRISLDKLESVARAVLARL